MDKQDWYEMGAQIGDLVQSAIDSKNFRQLNQSITDTINTTIEMVQKNKAMGKTAYQQAMERAGRPERSGHREGANPPRAAQGWAPATRTGGKKIAGAYKGIAYMGVGYSFAGIFGVMGAVFLSLTGMWDSFGVPALIFFLLALGFAAMGLRGGRINARVKRQKRYLQIMGERDVCTLQELAAGIGKSRRYVAKDLKQMMQDQMFAGEAFLDDQETCLMTSREAYSQYQQTMRQYQESKIGRDFYAKMKEGAETAEFREADQDEGELSREVQDILKEGRGFIAHIRQCNDRIPDQVMSEKLDRLERVVTRIFDQVADKPESAPDLHKMMSYYLPITRKLVDAYQEMDEQQVEGENIRRTKQEIQDSLDTINTAFENLLDSFFQDTAWDISSDISVLHTMMAQDGLMKRDFGHRGKQGIEKGESI